MRPFCLFIWLATVVFHLACGGQAAAERKALSRYARATLTPGVGLGDLQLGKTTLGWVTHNIGSGMPFVQAGDDTAIELEFLDGELGLLFLVTGECQKETGVPQTRLELGRTLNKFLARFPSCGKLVLTSLSVASRQRRPEQQFFRGQTNQGVRLGMPLLEARRHGPAVQRPGQWVPRDEYPDEPLERVEFLSGLYVYYPTGAGPTVRELQSNQPLPPERLREIEAAATAAAQDQTIKRLTIFQPPL